MFLLRKAAIVAALVTGAAVFGFAAPAQATEPVVVTIKVTNTPDDGCPTWARSTFDRKATITPSGEGQYKVVVEDSGEFETQPGAVSPGDPAVAIGHAVPGTIAGRGEFTVTGELLPADKLAELDGAKVNNGAYACKTDVPADRTTGQWPLRFFEPGATTPGITDWNWEYATCPGVAGGETRTEAASGAVGNIVAAEPCPPGVPDPGVEPDPDPEPELPAGNNPEQPGNEGSLPNTGSETNLLLAIAGVAGVLGVALVVLGSRRRRTTFSS